MATDETLSTELVSGQTEANVPGHPTPLAVWDVPDGSKWRIQQGHAAILDVEDVNGDNLPRTSKLGFAVREVNDPLDSWTVLNEFQITPFNQLGIGEQHSGDNAQRRRIRFDPEMVPGGTVVLSDTDELALMALSDTEADPASLFFNYPMQTKND